MKNTELAHAQTFDFMKTEVKICDWKIEKDEEKVKKYLKDIGSVKLKYQA